MLGLEDFSGSGGMGLILVTEVFNLLMKRPIWQKAVLNPGAIMSKREGVLLLLLLQL